MDSIEIITEDDVMEMETDPDPVDKEDAKNQNNGPAPTNTKTNDSPPANHSGGKREADITSPVIDVDGDATTKVCPLSRLCCYLCFSIVCSGHSTFRRRSVKLRRCHVRRQSEGHQEHDE